MKIVYIFENNLQIQYKYKFFWEDIFVNLAQTDILRVFIFVIIQRELQTCIE